MPEGPFRLIAERALWLVCLEDRRGVCVKMVKIPCASLPQGLLSKAVSDLSAR